MTLAPRVEVYTQIACRTLYDLSNPPSIVVPSSPLHTSTTPHTSGVVHVKFQDNPVKTYDRCTADPRVQARAARIQACMSSTSFLTVLALVRLPPLAVKTTESILSAATTGWLSHLSDRFGRKKILVLSMFGALFMSVQHLALSNSADLALGTSFISLFLTHPRCLGDMGKHSSLLHRL